MKEAEKEDSDGGGRAWQSSFKGKNILGNRKWPEMSNASAESYKIKPLVVWRGKWSPQGSEDNPLKKSEIVE